MSSSRLNSSSKKERVFARRWSWRLSGAILWLWLLSQIWRPFPGIELLAELSFWAIIFVLFLCTMVYLWSKAQRGQGCAALLLFYPFYVMFFPMTVIIWVLAKALSLLSVSAKKSQEFFWSFVPYLITAVLLVALFTVNSDAVVVGGLILAALNLVLVLLSLIVWIGEPLPWISRLAHWSFKYYSTDAAKVEIPTQDDFKSDLRQARSELVKAAKALKTAHSQMNNAVGLKRMYAQPMLIGAFARKFLVSLAHVAVLFGVVHFANAQLDQNAYEGLGRVSWNAGWFHFVYYGFMATVSGDLGTTVASSTGARAATLVNALVGVVILILLIAAFSNLTRERASEITSTFDRQINEVARAAEGKLLQIVETARLNRATDNECVKVLSEVKQFTVLTEKQGLFSASLAWLRAADHLESQGRDDEALLVKKAGSVVEAEPLEQFFHEQGESADLDEAAVLDRARTWLPG